MHTISKKYFPLLLAILLKAQHLKKINRMMLMLICEKETRHGLVYLKPKVYSDTINSIMNGEDRATRKHLRVCYNSFRKISDFVPLKRHGWSTEYEVMCFLYWMACGCSYRVAGEFMGLSRFTVKNIIHKLLDVFLEMRHIINHGSAEDYERTGIKFCRKAKSMAFRNVIGAIDGTHIRIQCPVNKHDEYINHKKFYSIQAQAVVDSNYKFTDVFVGYPGSVHDTRVFLNSPIFNAGTYPPRGYFLLGDKGYPCQTEPVAIITPFKEPLTSSQMRFNAAHSQARIAVECAFGMLKSRWRNIFNRDLELSVKNCIKTIFAAFILHNVCVSHDDFDPYDVSVELLSHADPTESSLSDSEEGILQRNAMFNEFLQSSI